MKNIEIDGLNFELFLSSYEIKKRILELSNILKKVYQNEWPVFLIVLNGGVVFANELIKYLDDDIELSVVKVRSYKGLESTGEMSLDYIPYDVIKNKPVLLIEDIVDNGFTLDFLKNHLKEYGALSVSCVTLLFKPSKYIFKNKPEYIGFNIAKEFVVGYGMDFNQKGRELKNIYKHIIHKN